MSNPTGVILAVVLFSLAQGAIVLGLGTIRLLPDAGLDLDRVVYGYGALAAALVLSITAFLQLLRVFRRHLIAWPLAAGCFLIGAVIDLELWRAYEWHRDDAIVIRWDEQSGVFHWGRGSVTFPSGFRHERSQGIDTAVGRFVSGGTTLEVGYDIGSFAGEHGGIGKTQIEVLGSRVRYSTGRSLQEGRATYHFLLTFLDDGCANFHGNSDNEADGELLAVLRDSFRPARWTPSWLRRMAPKVLRQDCRPLFR